LWQNAESTSRSYARDIYSRITDTANSITTNVNGQSREKTFTSQTRYDSLSRPKLYSYPISGLTLRNEYNGLGFTTKVIEQRSGGDITHWQANARNALGQITSMSIGGQIATNVIGQTTTKTYDSIGRVKSISTGTLQAASYEWDLIGNLTRRSDAAANAVNGGNEYFCHDKLNRVTHANAGPLNCTNPPSANFSYDPLGNLTKPGVTVAYQANSNKLLTVNGQTVQYDVGGNIISDGKRTYTYNPYDIPDSITQTHTTGNNPGTYQSQWGFGPDKQRTYELMLKAPVNGGNYAPIGMTWQPSPGHFELDEEINLNGTWVINECRHTIGSPEGNIGVVATNCISGNTMSNSIDRYYLKDHLGSNAGTFKQNILESRASYDVWGNRQVFTLPIDVQTGLPFEHPLGGFDTSNRGYTGHEHLTTFGLIHMNGRIYDPLLGRFMQADPIIDEPFNLQSYNRYAYVSNNPLAFTDPTGYSKWNRIRDRVIKPIAMAVIAYYTAGAISGAMVSEASGAAYAAEIAAGGNAIEAAGVANAAATAAAPLANAVGGAAAGFAAGGLQGGNLNSALTGAVTGGLGGYLSGGTNFQNPLSQIGNAASSLVNGQFQDLGRMALRYTLNVQMSRAQAKLAARLGISPAALDVSLMLASIAGNELVGSRFTNKDDEFDLTDKVGFRGYGNRKGTAGYFFDTVDAALAFQGKPTASLRDFAYSGLTGKPVTGHSLGTLDASYAVSHGLASRAELFSVPFGNVGPPSSTIRLGNFDPVNGGFLGQIFNWGALSCAIGFNHGYSVYRASGC
jgi:RHS repeat-associated protein